MKLFGHPDSGHAYKVKLCLTVGGIPHDYTVIDIFSPRPSRPAEFRLNARFQEVPLLLDGGKPYVQSDAILIHIAQKFQIFGGEDPDLFTHCIEWLFWEANKIGLCLPQLRADKKLDGFTLNPGARDWLLARYAHDVQILEDELADQRPFITGDQPTIADFSLCGYLYFADEAEVAVPTHVARWLDNISTLPGWEHPYRLLC